MISKLYWFLCNSIWYKFYCYSSLFINYCIKFYYSTASYINLYQYIIFIPVVFWGCEVIYLEILCGRIYWDGFLGRIFDIVKLIQDWGWIFVSFSANYASTTWRNWLKYRGSNIKKHIKSVNFNIKIMWVSILQNGRKKDKENSYDKINQFLKMT